MDRTELRKLAHWRAKLPHAGRLGRVYHEATGPDTILTLLDKLDQYEAALREVKRISDLNDDWVFDDALEVLRGDS